MTLLKLLLKQDLHEHTKLILKEVRFLYLHQEEIF